MPNFLAHHLFAKDLYLKYNLEIPYGERKFLKDNFYFLSWGSQGPDPLFYTGLLAHNGLHLKTALKKFGNQLHKDDGVKLFSLMCECYNSYNGEHKDSIKAFILGQFGHYLLDSFTHPFIMYESGFNEEGRIKGKYHYAHCCYEMKIDVSLAKKRDVAFYLEKPSEYLKINKEKLDIIDKFIVDVLRKYFTEDKVPDKVYSSGVKNMRTLVEFVNQGTKARTWLFMHTSLSAMRIDRKTNEDVLNLKNQVWLDPVTGQKEESSFIDLYNAAFKILEKVYMKIKDSPKLDFKDFEEYISGCDYYGKKLNDKMKYCKERRIVSEENLKIETI